MDLAMLAGYKQWADRLLYRALERMPAAERERPRRIVFGSLLRTLHHVYAMDAVWCAHLKGEAHGYATRNPDDCPSFAELGALQSRLDAWYLSYARELPVAAAREVVRFEFIGGNRGEMTRGDILLHVVNHGTYHRGHIGDMMYESDCHPPTTDLPVFLRSGGVIEL